MNARRNAKVIAIKMKTFKDGRILNKLSTSINFRVIELAFSKLGFVRASTIGAIVITELISTILSIKSRIVTRKIIEGYFFIILKNGLNICIINP